MNLKIAATGGEKESYMFAGAKQPNGPLGFAKFLFIAILSVAFYLLARSMVVHHFFSGGR
jgi:hypothetical protein